MRNLVRALVCACALLCALLPAPAKAETQVGFELYRGNRVVTAGAINGTRVEALVDTGASVHVIDAALADRLGLGAGRPGVATGLGGEQQGRFFDHVTIALGDHRLVDQSVLAIDLSALSRANGRTIELVVGRPLFEAGTVTIDFAARKLAFGAAVPAGVAPVRLARQGALRVLPVALDGVGTVQAVFDLGNPGALTLSPELHERLAGLAGLPRGLGISVGVGGADLGERVTLASVSVGDARMAAVPAELSGRRAGPFKGRANAGIQLFRHGRLTIDYANDRLFLETAASPTFDRDRSGLSLASAGDTVRVALVAPNSPAAKAGLNAADTITAIDGRAATPALLAAAWNRGPAGTRVALTKGDGATVVLVLGDYY